MWSRVSSRDRAQAAETENVPDVAAGGSAVRGPGGPSFLPLALIVQSQQGARTWRSGLPGPTLLIPSATPQSWQVIPQLSLPEAQAEGSESLRPLSIPQVAADEASPRSRSEKSTGVPRVTGSLGPGAKFSVFCGPSRFLQKVPLLSLWCQLSGSVTLA